MTLTLNLRPETEKILQERAAQTGQSVEILAVQLLEEALGANGNSVAGRAGQTFDTILTPVRKGWEDSGLSDDQVDQLFDDAFQKVRAEKRKGSAQ